MLMSKAAYAKHRGVSRQTVYDWIAKGEIVMAGSKIDVAATVQQASGKEADTTNGRWAHRTIEMTWAECWEAIKANDRNVPAPTTNAEIEQRVREAAEELNWNVEFLEDGGIYLDDGDTEYYFQQYDLSENALLAIGALRRELCYVADAHPDDPDDWSKAGMLALSIWAESGM